MKINFGVLAQITICSLVLCLFIGLNYFHSLPAVKEMITLATTVKPETFTELYFEDHINLPKTIYQYQEYYFTFTVHNLEHKKMSYPYLVYLQTVSKKIILDQGTINLEDGGYKSVAENFGPLKNIDMKITVELVDKNQLIDFLMTKQ